MKSYYVYIFTLVVLVSGYLYSGIGFPSSGPMDEAQLMQDYEQLQRGIEEYISSLSPEEQQEFYETQRMYEEMFSKMSDEERRQYMEELYQAAEEEMMQYYADLQANQPAENLNVSEIKTAPVQKEEPKIIIEYSKYSEIIQIIETILTKTESFLVKVNSIPDIAGRVARWVETKDITNWPANTTWSTFVHNVEMLYESIGHLLEKNPKTGLFKHLDAALESAPLIELLKTLSKTLEQNESLVKIASFGLEPMTKETKVALKTIITSYLDLEVKIRTSNDLQQVVAKFDPEAIKLKQEELAAQTAAESISNMSVLPAAGSVGGAVGYSGGSSGSYSPSGGYGAPYSSGGYYGGGYPSGSSYPATGSTSPTGSAGAGTGGSGNTGTTGDKNSNEIKTVREKDVDSERILGRIELVFNELNSYIKENAEFSSSNLKNTLIDTSDITDHDTELLKFKLPALSKLVNSCTSELSALARRVRSLGEAIQKGYKDDVKALFNSVGSPVKQLVSDISNAGNYWVSITADKRKLYFGSVDIPVELAPTIPFASNQFASPAVTPITPPTAVPPAVPVTTPVTLPSLQPVSGGVTGVPTLPSQGEVQENVESSMDVTSAIPQLLPQPTIPQPIAQPLPITPIVPEIQQTQPVPTVVPQPELPPVTIPSLETGPMTLITVLKKLKQLSDFFDKFPVI